MPATCRNQLHPANANAGATKTMVQPLRSAIRLKAKQTAPNAAAIAAWASVSCTPDASDRPLPTGNASGPPAGAAAYATATTLAGACGRGRAAGSAGDGAGSRAGVGGA